jgi:Family of unknown function (DUF6092)
MELDKLQDELFNLVAYMVTSARGLYDEPPDYGIFRLLDSSGRLLAIMESGAALDPFLTHLKEEIDQEREGNMDEDRQRERLDHLVLEIAHELQNRLSNI